MNERDAHSLSCCDAKRPILTRWLNSILKVFKMDSGYWVRPRIHRLGIWIIANVYLFMWINVKSSIKHLVVLL
jgi:hypothetical protein